MPAHDRAELAGVDHAELTDGQLEEVCEPDGFCELLYLLSTHTTPRGVFGKYQSQ